MMNKTHKSLLKKYKWYKNWHEDGLSTFVHWFVLIVFVFAFVFNSFAVLYLTNKARAASPWSIDSDVEWNQGTYTTTEASSGNLQLTGQTTWYNSSPVAFYDANFTYRRKIYFDNSGQAENLLNFPVMLKLTNDELNWSSAVRADLNDVIFVDDDNSTLLDFDWEAKDRTATSIAWAEIPQIDASSSTDFIYMYYGYASASDQTNSTGVWSNNYISRYSLSDASGHLTDSKTNYNSTAETNLTYSVAGEIGNAIELNGTDSVANLSDITELNSTTAFTFSCWMNQDVIDVSDNIFQKYNGTSAILRLWTTSGGNLTPVVTAGAASRGEFDYSTVYTAGTWARVTMVYDGSQTDNPGRLKLYINGDNQTMSFVGTIPATGPNLTTYDALIGGGANPFDGKLDEVQLSSIPRSANWIKASYLSESDQFKTLSAPETDNSYYYRRKIVFDNLAQGTNLTDYPVMVVADNASLSWNGKVQADLDDAIFVDADDSTPLSYGWDIKDPSGESVAWVKVPQIDASSNTDFIWMYYGNDSSPNLEDSVNVWTNGYEGVWTLNEGSGNTVYDKTKNGNNGTFQFMDDSNWAAGRAGGYALQFSGGLQYVLLDSNASAPSFPVTMLHSLLVDDIAIGRIPYTSDFAPGYFGHWTFVYPTAKIGVHYGAGTGSGGGDRRSKESDNAVISVTNWQTMAATIRGQLDMSLYIDGTEVAGTYTGTGGAYDPGTTAGSIGLDRTSYFKGKIDNIMYLSRDVSADEIAAYDLVVSGSFNTVGSELTHYSTSGTYSSVVKDMGFNSNLNLFGSIYSLNGGTASFSLRTGPTATPDGSWTGWVAVNPGEDPSATLDNNRFAQIKVDLASAAGGSNTPLIDSVTLSYESVSGSSNITFPVNGALLGPGNINIEGTAQSNSGAAIDRVEVSTNGGTDWSTAYTGGWSDAGAWNDWLYRQKITIDHTKVDANLSDFPVLISITNEDNSVFGKSQADGDDIAFTKNDKTTKLSHEIEAYNTIPGSRQLVAWVKTDLSSLNNTGLYMYYGNSTCGSQEDPTNVWDTDFKMVQHVDELSGTFSDSTINGNIGTESGGVTYGLAGQINKALGFDGKSDNDDYVNFGSDPSIDDIFSSGGTISFWINTDTPGASGWIYPASKNRWQIRFTGSPPSIRVFQATSGGYGYWSATTGTYNQWIQVAVTYNNSSVDNDPLLYVNGSPVIMTEITTPTSAGSSDAAYDFEFSKAGHAITGEADELHLSKTILPAEWISTEFNNQNDPGSFFSTSSEEYRGEAQPGGNTWSYIWNVAASGTYNLKSRVINEDSVVETPGAGVTVTIDADLPTSAINYPTNGSSYYSPNLLSTGTASDTGGAVVSAMEIRITRQGTGVIQDWTGVTNTGTNFSTWSYSQDGVFENNQTYILETRATDSVGNVQSPLTSSTINVDLTYPSSSITSPSDSDKFKVEDRGIEGVATANNGQPLSRVDVRVMKLSDISQRTTSSATGKQIIQDWTKASGTTSWSTSIVQSILASGGYYQIQSRATNTVNLIESPSPGVTILIDGKVPTTPANLVLRDVTNYSEGVEAAFLSFDKSQDSETKVSGYQVLVNEKETELNLENEPQDKVSLIVISEDGLKGGKNLVEVKAFDEVGNLSQASQKKEVTVESSKATISEIDIKNITVVSGKGDEEKTSALVTYTTDIPASTLVYFDPNDTDRDSAKYYSDSSLNYSHTAILSELVPDTNYKIKIEGIDAYGGRLSSDTESFRSTPRTEKETLFHIIVKALRDVFDWIKKAVAAPFTDNGNPDQATLDYLSLRAVDTSEKIESLLNTESQEITKNSLTALTYKKGDALIKDDSPFAGESSLVNSLQDNKNLLNSQMGIALDVNPVKGEKTTYKIEGKDNSTKVIHPGSEGEFAPEIYDIEAKEIITTEDKAEYLIIFKTDRPAKTEISGLSIDNPKDDKLNLSHSYYLSELKPGSTVKYNLSAESPHGKTSESGEKSFTVPAPQEEKGLWKIIVDALISAFGWVKNLVK